MDFESFSRRAQEAFDAIPEEYREGVDGLTVRGEALPHPTLPGVFTMGECVTEAYLSEWTGPDTLRSVVLLYFGSFRALAALDPSFDWEGEIWETITHEIRHHLESLADEDALEGEDYAMEEAFHRMEGEEFDPLYYRSGREVAPGVFQVEQDFFLEKTWDRETFEGGTVIEFAWQGRTWCVPKPDVMGDIHFVWIDGLDVGPGELQLVLRRKLGWKDRIRLLGGERELEMLESAETATPSDPQ